MRHSILVAKKTTNGRNVVFFHSLKEVIATKNGECVQTRNAELQLRNFGSCCVRKGKRLSLIFHLFSIRSPCLADMGHTYG